MKWETIESLEDCVKHLKNIFDRDFTFLDTNVEIPFAKHMEAFDAVLKARLALAMLESKCSPALNTPAVRGGEA